MAYKRAAQAKPGYSPQTGECYCAPETPRPPQSYRSSPPDSQMPPSESQLISQRKQMAGTK